MSDYTGDPKAKADEKDWHIRLTNLLEKWVPRSTLTFLVGVGVVVWATLYARDTVAQGQKASVDAGIGPYVTLQKETDRKLEEHLKDDREFRREVLRRLDENSADNRALYKTVLTGERQYRLERPLPVVADGGP